MRRLVCVCGAVVEGSEEELLEAVERHLAESHGAVLGPPSEAADALRVPVAPVEPAVSNEERSER